MRTAVVVVTGVHPEAMDAAMVSLAWDLPGAVAVRHTIDPESQVLTRVVSDVDGVVEQEAIALEHACVTCALREDILPTLDRLARSRRWSTIVACLPVGSTANQLVRAVAREPGLARSLQLSSVVAALDGSAVVDDLLGQDLLRERGLHSNPYDDRGVGEVGCPQVELADVVVVDRDPGAEGGDLLRALARPEAQRLVGVDHLDGPALVAGRHVLAASDAWTSALRERGLPALGDSQAWRVELVSDRPFAPERLLAGIERLGEGRHRSRGRFWLPTRAGDVLEWDGAGGQLSIGRHSRWGGRAPSTRLVFTGVGQVPAALSEAFEDLLLTSAEAGASPTRWRVLEDGFEPWLGDIREVA